MAYRTLLVLAATLATGCSVPEPPPRLVVVVIVDQMRADFLTRFGEQYRGGLARLTAEGAVFTEAHFSHALTYTSPGHASIATGTSPNRHGIPSNWLWEQAQFRRAHAVADLTASILGEPGGEGRSPANLQRDALGDWLKTASPESKVFSVAFKDHAAIPMGGQRPDAAYWFHAEGERFVTSTYYGSAYPEWMVAFNDSERTASLLARVWEPLLAGPAYALSRKDDFYAEADGVNTTFPHRLDETGRTPYAALIHTPFADELTLDFARELVLGEGLGGDDAPDLLWIGLSAADMIGHRYGPYSREVHDYCVRLDRMLEDLLAFLDEQVGAGGYVLALSSDHGVQPLTKRLEPRRMDARVIPLAKLENIVDRALNRIGPEFGVDPSLPIQYVYGLAVDAREGPPADKMPDFRRALAEHLREADFIADVFTYDELLDDAVPDRPYLDMYRKSFVPGRSPDLLLRFKENYLFLRYPRGTTHGSPYRYDTHVPIVFFGPGIAKGQFDSPVDPLDIAPTLAHLLGIEAPGDLDGRPLSEALR